MENNESDVRFANHRIAAVLGPTNTGKTHLAIERMLGHRTGIIGLPLRLLAREVYDKICNKVGAERVALVTGEEKIKPQNPSYWVATVEAMPLDIDVDFLAIDEVQLANDPERGHVFTDRLLNTRGRRETLFLGAQTMAGVLGDIVPKLNFISRPRLSKLSYAGQKKITRLPERSAIIAFSANEVYSLAELVRRQRGGAAVVLGALSPRTRNAQVALYQSGDVDYLIATDAIGMGLNLDVENVAFSSIRKFDGFNFRVLTPAELGQIAGRAGRHMNDGLFGVTGSCEPFTPELIEAIETHTFEPVSVLQWRSRHLDFRSLERLRKSLLCVPSNQRLMRARSSEDLISLDLLSEDPEVQALAVTEDSIKRLWEVCQLPDYRKISSQNHAELIGILYKDLMKPQGKINDDWFAHQVKISSRTEGDIDTLANRLAHIRTWTFVSNRKDWLKDPIYWQEKTRACENVLSDALHECLTQRFIDRKTSVLMKGLRENALLKANVKLDGSVHVEDHFVGKLKGFIFSPDNNLDNFNAKALRTAATQVLEREFTTRAENLVIDKNTAFEINYQGLICWRGEEIARLTESANPLRPSIILLADNYLSEANRKKIQIRLEDWLDELISLRLGPLVAVSKAEEFTGLAKGIAFSLIENFGALKRENYSNELKSLDQPSRSLLRKYGVLFGAYNIFFPVLLKPSSTQLLFVLWRLKFHKICGSLPSLLELPPRPGLTSFLVNLDLPESFYRVCGYHVCGSRAIRFDILERLSNIIRPLLSWKADDGRSPAPNGASGDRGFFITSEMISLLGCSTKELGRILEFMGFISDEINHNRDVLASKEKNGSFNSSKKLNAQKDVQNKSSFEPDSAHEVSDVSQVVFLTKGEESIPDTNIIWRPRRRFWENGLQKGNLKTIRNYRTLGEKTSKRLENENLQTLSDPNVPVLQNDEILKHKPNENSFSLEKSLIPEAFTYHKLPTKNQKNKKGYRSQSLKGKPSYNKPPSSEASSPFAVLMKIRSKLERSQREKGS